MAPIFNNTIKHFSVPPTFVGSKENNDIVVENGITFVKKLNEDGSEVLKEVVIVDDISTIPSAFADYNLTEGLYLVGTGCKYFYYIYIKKNI